jgi:hypothetical protein
MKERGNFKDLNVEVSIIVTWTLEWWDGLVWTGLL